MNTKPLTTYHPTYLITAEQAAAASKNAEAIKILLEQTPDHSNNYDQMQEIRTKLASQIQQAIAVTQNPYKQGSSQNNGPHFYISKQELFIILKFSEFQQALAQSLEARHIQLNSENYSKRKNNQLATSDIYAIKHVEIMIERLLCYGEIPANMQKISREFDPTKHLIEIENQTLIPQ